MLNSTVLDVAIGLVFTFLAMSLAVSSIVEAVASVLNWRSTTLLQGIKDLLNDSDFTGLARSMYNHALIDPRDNGKAQKEQDVKYAPAYIDPKQFADALVDVVQIRQDSSDRIKAAIDARVADGQLNGLLKGIVDRSAGDLTKLRDQIADWFDNSMDRLSGVYKRKTQLWSFAIALTLAGIFNVSAIDVGKALWQQPMLARTIAPSANLKLVDALQQLEELGLPIGWTDSRLRSLESSIGLEMLLGWLITGVATLFGAPFWFDALERIVRLKGSGPSPAEKRSGAGAAA
jgi:hypothetical protein